MPPNVNKRKVRVTAAIGPSLMQLPVRKRDRINNTLSFILHHME